MCAQRGPPWPLWYGAWVVVSVTLALTQAQPSRPGNPRTARWVEQLSWTPRAYVYHNFLSPMECEHVVKISRPLMRRSTVVGSGGKSVEDNIRTSYGTFLRRLQDPVISDIEQRLATWTMLNISHQEDMQILRYSDGQKYGAHYDSISNDSPRVATVLLYLGTKDLVGGETAFPKEALLEGAHSDAPWFVAAGESCADGPSPVDSEWLDQEYGAKQGPFSVCASGHVAMRPQKGDALLFYSLQPGLEQDAASMHTGCPVLNGTKWTATKWIHTKPFNEEWLAKPKAPELSQDPGLCLDAHSSCAQWAAAGECDKNAAYMKGDAFSVGSCRAACKACKPCSKSDLGCQAENRLNAGFLPMHLDDWE